jgi:enamine deaminase RidA (YjgF/YER057c/UK114 family)
MTITCVDGQHGRTLYSAGSAAEKEFNFSRAVKDGEWLFVANTSGYHYAEHRIDDSVQAQARQMLNNITEVMNQAGAAPQHIVRAVIYCPNSDDVPNVKNILSEFFSDIKPAVTLVCTPLAAPELRIEMEVTARLTVND